VSEQSGDSKVEDPRKAGLRARLAALRTERVDREKVEAKDAELEKLERDVKNEEAIAAAVAKHGPVGKGIAYVLTRLGVVIVHKPSHMLVRKFRDTTEIGKVTSQQWEELISKVLVHPSAEEWENILEEQNVVLGVVGMQVLALAGATDAEVSSK
jgi:hypothetical protein